MFSVSVVNSMIVLIVLLMIKYESQLCGNDPYIATVCIVASISTLEQISTREKKYPGEQLSILP